MNDKQLKVLGLLKTGLSPKEVSEETGIVSIAKEGRLSRNVTEAQIRKHLTSTMDEMTVIVERPGKSPVKKSTQDKKKV